LGYKIVETENPEDAPSVLPVIRLTLKLSVLPKVEEESTIPPSEREPAFIQQLNVYEVPDVKLTLRVWFIECAVETTSDVSLISHAVLVPSGAMPAAAVSLVWVLAHVVSNWLLCNTKFVLASSTNRPRLSPVVGLWSKRGEFAGTNSNKPLGRIRVAELVLVKVILGSNVRELAKFNDKEGAILGKF
jgi:hypothetical protein